MSVTPISDIVLEVTQAADPVRLRAATEKLTRMQSAADIEFGAALDDRAIRMKSGAMLTQAGASMLMRSPPPGVETASTASASGQPANPAASSVYRKFEAFVLQSFIESMLPQKAETVFGKGTAGAIWKSMLAEQIGNQIANAGGIGIARQLADAAHKRAG